MKKIKLIAGVDEVGRGCLAGPVVSCAVIFKGKFKKSEIKDSKTLTFKKRAELSKYIKKNSYYGIGLASVNEIEKYNILGATLISMERAINKLRVKPHKILIDGLFAPKNITNYKTIIRGDKKFKCISAASILAKVFRDNLMIKLSKKYKNYNFENNFGYGTKKHLSGIKKFGITTIHRKTFQPIHNILMK